MIFDTTNYYTMKIHNEKHFNLVIDRLRALGYNYTEEYADYSWYDTYSYLGFNNMDIFWCQDERSMIRLKDIPESLRLSGIIRTTNPEPLEDIPF